MNSVTSWLTALILVAVFAAAAQIAQNKTSVGNEGWSQFECGFNIINPSHLPFSFQFFIISLLFLIFDVEIALVLSYPLEPGGFNSNILILSFILILTLGLLYEWQNSNINWSEWVRFNPLQGLASQTDLTQN